MTTTDRRTLLTETVLVLGVSLGASAVWSVLSIARKLTAPGGLSAQTTSLVPNAWIECGFKDSKRGGWHWEQTKRLAPARAERLWTG